MVQLYPNLKLSLNQPSNNGDIHGVAGVKLEMNNTVCSIFQTVKREKTSVPKKNIVYRISLAFSVIIKQILLVVTSSQFTLIFCIRN